MIWSQLVLAITLTMSGLAFAGPEKTIKNDLSKIKFEGVSIAAVTPGAPQKLEEFKDKIVVIDFWASWCEPCKQALPHYNKLYKTYKNKNVIFLGINEDNDIKDRDQALKELALDFPIYQDKEQDFAQRFQVVALPSLYVLNRKHEVVALYRGFDKSKAGELEKLLVDLTKK